MEQLTAAETAAIRREKFRDVIRIHAAQADLRRKHGLPDVISGVMVFVTPDHPTDRLRDLGVN